jgi:hypothetical protein
MVLDEEMKNKKNILEVAGIKRQQKSNSEIPNHNDRDVPKID